MKYFLPFLLVATLLAGCRSDQAKLELKAGIEALEREIGASKQPGAEKLEALSERLEQYASAYPSDPLSAGYLARAAEMARINGRYEKALKIYDRILTEYAGGPEVAKALFMKGFTLDNDLKNIEAARGAYEEFLAKYPTDDFADDAQFLLKNLGKTEEEIIESFGAGQKTD